MPVQRLRCVAAHLRSADPASAPAAAEAGAVYDAVIVGAGFSGMYMLKKLFTHGVLCTTSPNKYFIEVKLVQS